MNIQNHISILLLDHPLHYIISNNSTEPKSCTFQLKSIEAGYEASVVSISSNRFCRFHHHRNSWVWCMPRSGWSKETPIIRFSIPISFIRCSIALWWFLVRRGVGQLFFGGFDSGIIIVGFGRFPRTNLCTWFHFIQPSEDPITQIPTNFNVSLLHLTMNLYCHIKYGSCFPIIRQTHKKKGK